MKPSFGRSEFSTIMQARLQRRTLLKGLAGATVTGLTSPVLASRRAAAPTTLSFSEVAPHLDHTHHVAAGYRASPLLRWGDPILTGASPFDPRRQSARAQAGQFGYNNDFLAFTPLSEDRGLLSVNHEYTDAFQMFPGLTRATVIERLTVAQARVEQMAHGHTVVEVRRTRESWEVVRDGAFNRRITASTPMRLSGPAAGHRRMQTAEDPSGRIVRGTLANCSGGQTPWGTILTAEENVDFYFAGNHPSEARNHDRFGVSRPPLLGWYRFDTRFRVNETPHEPNRFGWIVEIDPKDPTSTPIKRTALGRFKHESGTVTLNHDNRVVVYSGDDQRFEYLYRYVSRHPYDPSRPYSEQPDLLDDGVLSAAKFHADGTVEWLPLVFGNGPLTEKNGFFDQGDVLIETRYAADLMGATKMDRPEDVEIDARTGRVLVALSNNHLREETDAANPRAKNEHGHIAELLVERRGSGFDFASDRHRWDLFLLGGDPRQHGGSCHPETSKHGWLSCPDNLAFDPHGRVWICTDGQDRCGMADALYASDVTGPGRGLTRRFFVAPRGAEVTGATFTPDGATLFVSVQHPGQEDEATYERPTTRWPDFDPSLPPRPSVVVITKKGGGTIGS